MLKNVWLNYRHWRNRKSLVWKQRHQKEKESWFWYYFWLIYAYIMDFIKGIFRLLCFTILLTVLISIWFLNAKVKPLYEKYEQQVDEILVDASIEDFKINQGSIIYNSDGEVIANLFDTANLEYVEYKDIPQDVIDAFVAIEDQTFWTNTGIDYMSIAKVVFDYVHSDGENMRGASTITQQLARNIYLTHEVSFDRKIKEILISQRLTETYTKEQIIEFYCNDICFANGIYGIQGASRAYFNKDIQECNLSEIAYLCAIPNRPEYYNPFNNPNTAIERRDLIIDVMFTEGYITQEELDEAKTYKIKIEEPEYAFNNYETTYALDCAIRYFMRLDGFKFKYYFETQEEYDNYHTEFDEVYQQEMNKIYHGGYHIYTSLDSEVYAKLQEILDNQLSFDTEIDEDTEMYALQGALTVIDNSTHKTVAVVGGRTQEGNNSVYSLNRAFQGVRQPGSSFKPIAVYTPALEWGYNADSQVTNISVAQAKQTGVDAQKLGGSKTTLRYAVEKSLNGTAWQVFDKLTPNVCMSYITNMRFSHISPDDYYNSSSLGGLTYGVETTEMAAAYSCLTNHGSFNEDTCIISIIDSEGRELYIQETPLQVYKMEKADEMVDILKGVVTRGTATSMNWYGYTDTEAFAKTGTTNDNKDGWMCGATSYYSIAVWVGFDTPRSMSNLYGSTYPARIWRDSMLYLIEGKETTTLDEAGKTLGDYYSYLEGRDDSEIISENYTVADYRKDRVIGETVYAIIEEMEESTSFSEIEELYKEAYEIISTIYSNSYANELKTLLEGTYKAKFETEETTQSTTEVDENEETQE